MVKNDMQLQILQMLYNEVNGLDYMPKHWRDDDKDDDDIYCIHRRCGRGTIDKGAAEHFDWLDDRHDYCERMYDCYTCVYECPKFDELSIQVREIQDKFKKNYPDSKVSVEVDGFKDVFYLKVEFVLSDKDFEKQMKKLEKKKIKPKKEDGEIVMSERGKEIVLWLQEQPKQSYTAREIAEGLFCSPSAIPGAMKKLITDGLVEAEKVGTAPNNYKLTDAGVSIDVNAQED